jgi:hypothetical protein
MLLLRQSLGTVESVIVPLLAFLCELTREFRARSFKVLGLLAEVETMGEIENVRAQLPAEFRQLFEVENEGE